MPELPDPRCILALPTAPREVWQAFRQQFMLDWQQVRFMISRARRRPDPVTQAAVDVDTIQSTEEVRILTAAGATLMISTPTLEAGEDGITVMLINLGPGTITFQDEATLPGSLLRLRAGTVAIPANQTISLYWCDEIQEWMQVSP